MKERKSPTPKKKEKGTTPMDAALKYLTTKARTVREMELYLDKREYGEYEVYQVVERLKELGYLNDEAYACDFVRTRLATRPISRAKLKEQLYAHKLSPDAIDAAISGVSDEEEQKNAAAVAEKYMRIFCELPQEQKRKRLLQRLCARGYGYDTVRACMAGLTADMDEEEYRAACAHAGDDAEDEL